MATRVGAPGRKRNVSESPSMAKVFFAIAVVCFLFMYSRKGSSGNGEESAAAPDSIEVVVPVAPIPAGSVMREQQYERLVVARRSVTKDVVTTVADLQSLVTTVNLAAGIPFSASNLSSSRSISNPVSGKIPPGMRAITVKVDATSSVEGWAGSGSVVDVLLVEKNRTTVVAEKVRVLSAERSTSPVEGLSMPSVPSTVTLLVTQEQTLSINTAVPLGRIAFALRSANDDSVWRDTSYSADRLSAASVPSTKHQAVTGFASIGEGDNAKRFALTNGKWLVTSSTPDGFFVAEQAE